MLLGTVPMSSISKKKDQKISSKDWLTLLSTARHAIKYGLTYHNPPLMELKKHSKTLQENAACFVTLKEQNTLRGCIGSLEASQPLIQDVADHAYAAAFKDPRFPPVSHLEEPLVHISISVLSSPLTINFGSEADLLQQIEEKKDGLILQYGHHKGTFLPSVWKQLPDKQEFLNHLKMKAGLAEDFWSDEINVLRYSTQTID